MCGLKKALMAGFIGYEYILEQGCKKMETSAADIIFIQETHFDKLGNLAFSPKFPPILSCI